MKEIKNNSNVFIKTLSTKHEIKDKHNNTLEIKYLDDLGEKLIELDGIIDIENIQVLINSLTQLKNDFGDNNNAKMS